MFELRKNEKGAKTADKGTLQIEAFQLRACSGELATVLGWRDMMLQGTIRLVGTDKGEVFELKRCED